MRRGRKQGLPRWRQTHDVVKMGSTPLASINTGQIEKLHHCILDICGRYPFRSGSPFRPPALAACRNAKLVDAKKHKLKIAWIGTGTTAESLAHSRKLLRPCSMRRPTRPD